MTEAVRLAIAAPPPIRARAAATLDDLLTPSGVVVGRTGSVVLDWPCAELPLDEAAWDADRPLDDDPVAFAHRRLAERGPAGAWEAPVDDARERVAAWARGQRLLVRSPWPEGATCAIAVVHEAMPLPRPATGLRARLRRREAAEPTGAYARVAAVERRHGLASALIGLDVLANDERAALRVLGFALGVGPDARLAGQPGFRRGTAFPARRYDPDAERLDDAWEVPLLGDAPAGAVASLAARGGGAALAVPVAELADPPGLAAYDALLGRLRAAGAWLTRPDELVARLAG